MIPYLAAVILFAVGVFAIVSGRGRHKAIIGMGLVHFAAALVFCLAGWRTGGEPPLVTSESWEATSRAVASGSEAATIHDPTAQAMAAMVILIGTAMTVLAAAIHSKLQTLSNDDEGGPSEEATS